MAYLEPIDEMEYASNLLNGCHIPYCAIWNDEAGQYLNAFDDKHVAAVQKFLASSDDHRGTVCVVLGDLIPSTGYQYDEGTKRILAGAMGVTLDGESARIFGVKLIFGVVHSPSNGGVDLSWEAIRRIVCSGGQFVT